MVPGSIPQYTSIIIIRFLISTLHGSSFIDFLHVVYSAILVFVRYNFRFMKNFVAIKEILHMNLFRMQVRNSVQGNSISSNVKKNIDIVSPYLFNGYCQSFLLKRWNVFQTLEEAGCSLHLTVHLFLDLASVFTLSQGGKKVHLLAVPRSQYLSPLHMKQRAIINETPPYGWSTTLSKILPQHVIKGLPNERTLELEGSGIRCRGRGYKG